MKRTRQVINDGSVQTKNLFQNATDTFRELAAIFLLTIVAGGIAYSVFEKTEVLDGIWWAFVTAFTVGYGDVVPGTMAGRVVAAVLMSISVFVIVPLVTALMTKRAVVDNNAWTNDEQKMVVDTAVRMNEYLDRVESQKAVDAPKKKTVRTR